MPNFCAYCGKPLQSHDAVCPNCGRPIIETVPAQTQTPAQPEPLIPAQGYEPPPQGYGTPPGNGSPQTPPQKPQGPPRTIGELRAYADAHNWPLADMRFFLGEDYRGARAFGIYESNGEYIVYKNKADGSRAVRYRGPDEAYAVNELFQKMRSEVANQKAAQSARFGAEPPSGGKTKTSKDKQGWLIPVIIIFVLLVIYSIQSCSAQAHRPGRGYYDYDDRYYYYQAGDWYYYDDYYDDWYYTAYPPSVLVDDYDDYYYGESYSAGYGVEDFSDSGYYDEYAKDDNGWSWSSSDSDDDWWDSGSDWDSGFTDWDSDW